jgi:hypothetical protein
VQQQRSDEEVSKRMEQVTSRVDLLHEHVNKVETSIQVRPINK